MKKILAVVLSLTLCVVGLPFTASAAEIIGGSILDSQNENVTRGLRTCDCDAVQVLVNYPGSFEIVEYYMLANKCHRRYYTIVRAQCTGCNQLYDEHDVYETIYSHTYHPNGLCKVCGYDSAG